MMVAAPRPAANASRQGEACPKFMAAIKTPKKTWRKRGKVFYKLLKYNIKMKL